MRAGSNDRGSVLSPLRTVRPPKKLAAGPSGNGSWDNSPPTSFAAFFTESFSRLFKYITFSVSCQTQVLSSPHILGNVGEDLAAVAGARPFHRARRVLRRLPAFALSHN